MTNKRVIVNKPGTAPKYHAHRIARLVRDATTDGTISPAWQIPILMRHYDAAKQPRPQSIFFDMAYPYIIGALTEFPDNTIVDPRGYATKLLHDRVPEFKTNFNPVMRKMEQEGYVVRRLGAGGRRTTAIQATTAGLALLNGWLPHRPAPDDLWLGDYGPVAPVVAIAPPPSTNSDPTDIDITSLSRLCLRLGIERDEWASKFFQAEGNIDKLVARMGDQEKELQELRRRLDGTPTVYSSGSDPSVLRARLSDDERASLDRLMREVPTG